MHIHLCRTGRLSPLLNHLLTNLLACILVLTSGCVSAARTQEAPTNVEAAPTPTAGVTTANAATEPPAADNALGDEIALRAIALVGKPYRYGGADLDGFDCSGLVYFIHQELGITVPRTAADQQRAAIRIKSDELQPGDLLFFRTNKHRRISHVGVYVGDHRFVHAPHSGKLIELSTLDDTYYGPRLVSSGRLAPAS
jgi:murein DD-endopeptidase